MCLAAMTASAQTARQSSDSLYIQKSYSQEQMLIPVNPTYLKHVSEAANWGRNWFIEAKGGASAFLGTPIGCGDVFDRVTPLLQIGVGKWFTPAIGGRIGFQGLSFKNAEFHTMNLSVCPCRLSVQHHLWHPSERKRNPSLGCDSLRRCRHDP